MNIIAEAGFHTHLLVPHRVVGSMRDYLPLFLGLTAEPYTNGVAYRHNGLRIFDVTKKRMTDGTRVTMRAATTIWIQEPGVELVVAGGGVWLGVGPNGYTTPPLGLRQKDAHFSTTHFSRVRHSPNYTIGVEYREGSQATKWFSGSGFAKPLYQPASANIPWQGCQVFGQDYELRSVFHNPNEVLRRWELAAKAPDIGQMYFLGWTGGPGCAVNAKGVTPGQIGAAPGERYDYLYNPRSWRQLMPGQEIVQGIWRGP